MEIIIIVSLMASVVLGWFIYRQKSYQVPNPIEASGEVVEIEIITLPGINPLNLIRGKQNNSVKYHPVVKFKLDQEKRVRFRNRKGYASQDKYKKGDTVQVLYSQDNPLVAKIKE